MTAASVFTTAELAPLLDNVPDFERFLRVDELVAQSEEIAAAAPSGVTWRRVGTSRLGEPIHELVVGSGSRHALVFAGVHPNEPIGSLTALHLARTLAGDAELAARLDYTWHIIPCIDPDGMRLNENWFTASINRVDYARWFYRPAPNEQVEWTFPFAYKDVYFDQVLPETLALMRIIDDVRPAFMCSLHNGELGGVYYYLSDPAPELYPTLAWIPEQFGLPLDVGEPEAPYIPVLAPAIYGEIRMEDAYEYVVNLGGDPTALIDAGDSSNSYTRKYGTFSLVSELPYWVHRDASDESPSPRSYAAVLSERASGVGELADLLGDVLRATSADLTIDSPFLRASRQFAAHLEHMADQEAKRAALPDSDRPATVAEAFSGTDLVHSFRLRYGGMLLRALDAEIGAGHGTPAVRREHARLGARYDEWCRAALEATPAETVPLRALVGVQFGAIVAAAAHAAGRSEAAETEDERHGVGL